MACNLTLFTSFFINLFIYTATVYYVHKYLKIDENIVSAFNGNVNQETELVLV